MSNKLNQHKITADLQRKIYLVASTLPPMGQTRNGEPYYKSVMVPGTKVKKEDLKPGSPIILTAMYKINELQYVNHAMEICSLVKRDGPGAIESYESDVWALHRIMVANDKKLNSPLNRLKKWIKKTTR